MSLIDAMLDAILQWIGMLVNWKMDVVGGLKEIVIFVLIGIRLTVMICVGG